MEFLSHELCWIPKILFLGVVEFLLHIFATGIMLVACQILLFDMLMTEADENLELDDN